MAVEESTALGTTANAKQTTSGGGQTGNVKSGWNALMHSLPGISLLRKV